MRTIVLSLGLMLGMFLASSAEANAQCESRCSRADAKDVAEAVTSDLKKATFAVQGNCSMCEARIEKAAKSVEGVKEASWDKENDMLTIKYRGFKDKVDRVHDAIAEAGHDTSKEKASQKAYASLPGCCKYREE